LPFVESGQTIDFEAVNANDVMVDAVENKNDFVLGKNVTTR